MTPSGSAEVYEIARDVPEVPDGLEPPRGDAGQVVALLADKASRSHGWCGHFALALASRWCGPQRQVVIADGDLERGSLHSIADVPNDEGIGDLLRYGASSKRVIRQLSPAGPHLIPAGTVVCDPEESLRDSRWSFLLDELRGNGTTLLVYLPADSAGAVALAAEADGIIHMVSGAPAGNPAAGGIWVHAVDPELHPEHGSAASPVGKDASGGRTVPASRPQPKPKRGRRLIIAMIILVLLAAAAFLAGPG